jgi:hypothetical protein
MAIAEMQGNQADWGWGAIALQFSAAAIQRSGSQAIGVIHEN